MNATRILARWICTIAFLAVGVATLQGLAIVVFIICGTLVPGERMFGDSATPSLAGAIILSAISLAAVVVLAIVRHKLRSEEHTSELQSLMRISYAVFCLKKKRTSLNIIHHH